MIDEKWINVDVIKCEDAVKPCHYYPACPVFYHVEGIIEFSAMAERELDILPEANNVSDINSYDLKQFFETFFKGLSNFIKTNFDKRYSGKDPVAKRFLIHGLKGILNELESLKK